MRQIAEAGLILLRYRYVSVHTEKEAIKGIKRNKLMDLQEQIPTRTTLLNSRILKISSINYSCFRSIKSLFHITRIKFK